MGVEGDAADAGTGRTARLRARAAAARARVESRVEQARRRLPVVDLGVAVLERDGAIGGGLMSAALAFRLFLFQVPLALLLVGVLGFVSTVDADAPSEAAEELGVSGALAESMGDALVEARSAWWIALSVGLFGVAFAGRNLVRSLVEVRARAWALPGRQKARPATIAAAIGIVLLTVALGAAHSRLDERLGVLATPALLAVSLAADTGAFLLLALVLPRATRRWADLLPGAVLMAVGLSVMHVVSQVYLPGRVERASTYYGALGVAFAVLAWLFLLGRLVVLSAELDALVWARHGGIGGFVVDVLRFRSRGSRPPAIRPTVVTVTWPDRFRALEVVGALAAARREDPLPVEDTAVVEVDDEGRRHLIRSSEVGEPDAPARDGLGGLIAGTLLGMPVLGLATGLGTASIASAVPPARDTPAEELVGRLAPGSSALVLVVRGPVDAVLAVLAPFGGVLLVDGVPSGAVAGEPVAGPPAGSGRREPAAP